MVAMNVWPTDGADGSVASEARWRKMGRIWAPSGVIGAQGGEMKPTLAMPNLTVKSGAAWVDGHYAELPSDQVLTATANGLAVVRFDPAANTAELLWRDGVTTPAQSPTGIWELPIASTSGSTLTDRRVLFSPRPPTYEYWWHGPLGGAFTNLDVNIAGFTMPFTGHIHLQGEATIIPGATAGLTVALVSAAVTSVPPPTNRPVTIGPYLAANQYRVSVPIFGLWSNVPIGTTVALKVGLSSSAGHDLAIDHTAGIYRLIPA